MSTSTFVVTYAYTVTYVAAKMLNMLSEIIREIGLDPKSFAASWSTYEEALTTWLTSRHLKRVRLEVYDPKTDNLVTAWDIDVVYGSVGEGTLWVDVMAIRYAIAKAGLVPLSCRYDIIYTTEPGRPAVNGWGPAAHRSTAGLKRYAIGSTTGGNGLTAEIAYWRR
jgi:hypothetical protein